MARDLLIGPFTVEYAFGAAPRTDEYRLRYRVFVEEHPWLSAGALPDRLERDEFDDACCSVLLRDAETGEAAACQRLILPERLVPGLRTQIERLFQPLPGVTVVDFNRLPRHSWAEVSRSTIAPKYRWGSSTASSLPAMAAITYASIALAVAVGRTTLFSVSDVRTMRLVRRLGFALRQIGSVINYHGKRAPFSIDVHDVLRSVPSEWESTMYRLIVEAIRVVSEVRLSDDDYRPHAA
jgi:N-acyl amino acid synthase of PEP-CTERM/exosortase system